MKKIKKIMSFIMSIVMVISLFAGVDITSVAEYEECGHINTTEHPANEATCEENGYTAGVQCDDCDEWLSGHIVIWSSGHVDGDNDLICDNCSGAIISINVVADKTEIYPGETVSFTVYFENAKGLKEGSVDFPMINSPATKYVDFDFNDDLTYTLADNDMAYNFAFNEPVKSETVEIVTVTYIAIKPADNIFLNFHGDAVGFVMVHNYDDALFDIICAHSNTTECPEEAPSCTINGYSAGVQCDDCGEWISGHEKLDSLGSHIDETGDNICDRCGWLTTLLVGENIISTDSGMTSVKFKAEKAGLYEFEYSSGLSFEKRDSVLIEFNNNSKLCFYENEEIEFKVDVSDYTEETYFIKVTHVDDAVTGHCDKDFNSSCDNCDRAVKTDYFVDFNINGSQAVIKKGDAYSELIPMWSYPVQDGPDIPYEETRWYGAVSPKYTWLYPSYIAYDEEDNKTTYTVTEISEGAFVDYSNMEDIIIPNTVKTIGKYAVGYTAENPDAKIENFVIYGYKNSAAQTYALQNGFEFKPLFDYEIINNEVVITSVCEYFGAIDIPLEVEGYTVTTIGENCFADKNIHFAELHKNITTLKTGAFKNNPNFNDLTFYSSLKTIEAGAFESCAINYINYHGTPALWNEITIGENNDSCLNAKIYYYGTGHKDFDYMIENDSVAIDYINDYADFNNFVIPATLDGYPVTELKFGGQSGTDVNSLDYYQITIPASVTSIQSQSVGYFYQSGEYILIPDFKILGVPGSYAETYANENGITFVAIESDSADLEVEDESITVDTENNLSSFEAGKTADEIAKMIKNDNFAIVDKDGNELSENALVGTGAKIQIKDNNGNVTNEYIVVVPSDVDGNGEITASDARVTLRTSAGLTETDGVYAMAADIDNNQELTASDARKILRKAAGLE